MVTKAYIREQTFHHIAHFLISIPLVLFVHPLFVLGLSCGLELWQHWEVVEWFLRGEIKDEPFGWWELNPRIRWVDLVLDLVSWNIFAVIVFLS